MRRYVDSGESNREDEEEWAALLSCKFKRMELMDQRALVRDLKDTDVTAWDIQDLEPAHVSMVHSFQLIDDPLIHSRVRDMAPNHNDVLKKEVNTLLEVGIITPAGSAWLFPAFIVTKKDGRPRSFFDYRQLNRVMNPDRWLFPRIEELFNNLAGTCIFTKLDLYMPYSYILD